MDFFFCCLLSIVGEREVALRLGVWLWVWEGLEKGLVWVLEVWVLESIWQSGGGTLGYGTVGED